MRGRKCHKGAFGHSTELLSAAISVDIVASFPRMRQRSVPHQDLALTLRSLVQLHT